MSPQKTKAVHAAGKRQYTAADSEVQVPWVVFANDGTRKWIHGSVKQMQFCVSFIALWSQNGSFQTSQSCEFLNKSLFRCSPVVTNPG